MNGKNLRYGERARNESRKHHRLIRLVVRQTIFCALVFLICLPISKTQSGLKGYISRALVASSDIDLAKKHFVKMCDSIGSKYPKLAETDLWKEFMKANNIEDSVADSPENAEMTGSIEKALELVANAEPAEFAYPENVNMIMPLNGKVTSSFGEREHPVDGGESVHYGVDISGNLGDGVVTTASGKVIEVKNHEIYGNCVLIQHTSRIKSFYAHLDTVAVKEGDILADNAKIGTVGATGVVTGPHLHFGVRVDDVAVNPEIYINMEHK